MILHEKKSGIRWFVKWEGITCSRVINLKTGEGRIMGTQHVQKLKAQQ